MILVVDTNRILAALIRDSTARNLLFSLRIHFIAPHYIWEEIEKYKEYTKQKSKLTENAYRELLNRIQSKVETIPKERIEPTITYAERLIGDIDLGDVPILACALAVPNDGIWSEDKHFLAQHKAKIWNTIELIKYLEESESSH